MATWDEHPSIPGDLFSCIYFIFLTTISGVIINELISSLVNSELKYPFRSSAIKNDHISSTVF